VACSSFPDIAADLAGLAARRAPAGLTVVARRAILRSVPFAFLPVALVPAYRCAATIGVVVKDSFASSRRSPSSTTGATTQRRGGSKAGARVVSRAVNGGKGSALCDGLGVLLAERWTHVAFVDGDGQHDPADLPRLLAAAARGADFVVGSRLSDRGEMPGRTTGPTPSATRCSRA